MFFVSYRLMPVNPSSDLMSAHQGFHFRIESSSMNKELLSQFIKVSTILDNNLIFLSTTVCSNSIVAISVMYLRNSIYLVMKSIWHSQTMLLYPNENAHKIRNQVRSGKFSSLECFRCFHIKIYAEQEVSIKNNFKCFVDNHVSISILSYLPEILQD